MARSTIVNSTTGAEAYQAPGTSLPAGYDWINPKFAIPTPVADGAGKPVTMLSTDSAINTLNRNTKTLDGVSPTTAPGYVAPAPQQPNNNSGTVTTPKGYFTNEMGQEAEFTQDQLNDPANQKFLTDNGYVMTRTEGPQYNPGSGLQNDLQTADKKLSDVMDQFINYNIDSDPQFATQASSIHGQFDELRAATQKLGDETQRALTTLGMRGGAPGRFTPERQLAIHADALSGANETIGELNRKEADAVTTARTAFQNNKFQQYNTQVNLLKGIRDSKAKALSDYSSTVAKVIKDVKETTIRASRDSTIAGLVQQGITDPAQLLNYLNFDNSGKQVGDFTAKEIKDSLASLTGTDKYKDLSGDTKEFYQLKGLNQLPSSVSNLPDDQQLFAYLRQKKTAETINGGTKSGVKITPTVQRQLGLPISTVGMTQDEIFNDLQSPEPPPWFVEKLHNDLGKGLTPNPGSGALDQGGADTILAARPDSINSAWDVFRQESLQKEAGTAPKPEVQSNNYKKALQYFTSTYDGLSDDQLNQIATEVETYVNGGKSYADAVKQVETDLSQ